MIIDVPSERQKRFSTFVYFEIARSTLRGSRRTKAVNKRAIVLQVPQLSVLQRIEFRRQPRQENRIAPHPEAASHLSGDGLS